MESEAAGRMAAHCRTVHMPARDVTGEEQPRQHSKESAVLRAERTLRGVIHQSNMSAAASEFLGDGAATTVGERLEAAAVGVRRGAKVALGRQGCDGESP